MSQTALVAPLIRSRDADPLQRGTTRHFTRAWYGFGPRDKPAVSSCRATRGMSHSIMVPRLTYWTLAIVTDGRSHDCRGCRQFYRLATERHGPDGADRGRRRRSAHGGPAGSPRRLAPFPRRRFAPAPSLDVAPFVGSGFLARCCCRRQCYAASRLHRLPDARRKAGPRAVPGLVPTTPDDPASAADPTAWRRLSPPWIRPFPRRVQRSRSDHTSPRSGRSSSLSSPVPELVPPVAGRRPLHSRGRGGAARRRAIAGFALGHHRSSPPSCRT